MPPSEMQPFVLDVEPVHRDQRDFLDVHTSPQTDGERRPAVVLVHGGPVPPDAQPRPREWSGFLNYAALAANAGLVAVTFDHRLHTSEDYPLAAEDVASAVAQARTLEGVDPDRVGLWFFSGSGVLAAEWLAAPPEWLACVALNYPVLAPPADWDGDVPRFDAVNAVAASPGLPKLLVRVSEEHDFLAQTQDAFVNAARANNAALEVIEVPEGKHAFEVFERTEQARTAVARAVNRVSTSLHEHASAASA